MWTRTKTMTTSKQEQESNKPNLTRRRDQKVQNWISVAVTNGYFSLLILLTHFDGLEEQSFGLLILVFKTLLKHDTTMTCCYIYNILDVGKPTNDIVIVIFNKQLSVRSIKNKKHMGVLGGSVGEALDS